MKKTITEQISANNKLSLFYSFLIIVTLGLIGGAATFFFAPEFWYAGLFGALAIGIVLALVAWFAGSKIVLQMSNARTATEGELRLVHNLAEEMAIAAGIPTPQIYIIDDPSPNAFATGSDPRKGYVIVTTGLLRMLDRDELQGVVAHEVAHIRNNDIKLMTTLAIVAGLIPLIADITLRSLWYSGGGRRSSGGRDGGGNAIMLVIALALLILAPIFAKMLELAVSRRREYMADATAVELTRNPLGLMGALEKLGRPPAKMERANRGTEHMFIVNPLNPMSAAQSMFSTHPPLRARIAALQSLAGSTHKFIERDQSPPIGS